MDNTELRLELIRIAANANHMFKSEDVVQVAIKYEAYITSGNGDKAKAPSDPVKEQQKGKTVSSKRKPR